MKRLDINASIESFLVMLLMIAFTISVAMIIIEGKGAFERVTENKLQDEHARIAMSYVNKRIKQNDHLGAIEVVEDGVEGLTAIRIAHDYEDFLYTYIFYKEGMLYECYTDMEPTFELSTEIIPAEGVEFSQEGNKIVMSIIYEYQGQNMRLEQVTYLRTGGLNE